MIANLRRSIEDKIVQLSYAQCLHLSKTPYQPSYWRKPSVLFKQTAYEDNNVIRHIHEQIENFIVTVCLKVMSRKMLPGKQTFPGNCFHVEMDVCAGCAIKKQTPCIMSRICMNSTSLQRQPF